jgi:hypothetical protein
MNDNQSASEPIEDDDAKMKEVFESALEESHPEEDPTDDPFATDALGHEPAEEDDGGRV